MPRYKCSVLAVKYFMNLDRCIYVVKSAQRCWIFFPLSWVQPRFFFPPALETSWLLMFAQMFGVFIVPHSATNNKNKRKENGRMLVSIAFPQAERVVKFRLY